MALGAGIVIGVYLGVRLYEVTGKRSGDHKLRGLIKRISYKRKKPGIEEAGTVPDETKRAKHFVIVSGVSLGSAMARFFYPPLTMVTIALLAYVSIPYLRVTEKSLFKKKKIDGYVLYATADLMMLWLGALATAALGIGLLHVSQFVLFRAKDRSKKLVVDAFASRPLKVWVIKDGAEIQVLLESIQVGDIVIVNAGEVIPVDGIIKEGLASIDQRALTGESQPADKFVGDQVFASTLLISGRISVQVEKSGQETTVAQINDIINNAIDFKSSSELKGEQWANAYTMPLMVMGIAAWPFLGPAGTVAILYTHIANTIRVVAPLSTLNYMNIALKKGILIKDGRILEELKNVDTVVFDKTGTLTEEIPEVGRILLSDVEFSKDELLFYAAAAEYRSTHPIAKAILNKAEERNLVLPEIEESSYEIGYGVSVKVKGKAVLLGSRRFMMMSEVMVPKNIDTVVDESSKDGDSIILIAVDGKVRGAIEMQAKVRPEVSDVLSELNEIGVKYKVIISGDQERPTKALANALGMDEYYFDVLPEDKANLVVKLQHQGRKVAFIGDGVNDVIAMKKADVSISISGSTAIATDVAKIVLLDGTLLHLPYLFRLSLGLNKNLQRSLVINVVPSAMALYGILFLHFTMLMSMLLSESPLVLGAVNAYIPFKDKRKEIESACSEIEHRYESENLLAPRPIEAQSGWLSAHIHALRVWAIYPGTLYRRYINKNKPPV